MQKNITAALVLLLLGLGLVVWYALQPNEIIPQNSLDSQPTESDAKSQSTARKNMPALEESYAKLRKSQINSVDYQLSFELDKTSKSFTGRVVINVTPTAALTQALTIDFTGGAVKKLTVNGLETKFEYNGNFITIQPDSLSAGENAIQIEFSHAYNTDGRGLHRFEDPKDGNVYLYTQFEAYEANKVFPHFDQPDIKATYQLDVLAPSDWTVISAATVEKQHAKGDQTHWYFNRSALFSSYVLSLFAGPYHVWEDQWQDIPLRLFVRQSLVDYVKIDDWFEPTKKLLAFYNGYFEMRYSFLKYDQIIVPDFNFGAMENVAAVSFAEHFVSRGEKTQNQRQSLAITIAHEMAHMWFGDLVTMKWWNGLWLNESFATIMAAIALDNIGYENVWERFYSRMKQWAYWADELVTTHSIELPVNDTTVAFTNFDGITYGKGASVLKQLNHYLGAENFRKGVVQYLKTHAYKNTELQDFIYALANVAATDLSDWQKTWLSETGLNTIEINYQCSKNKISSFELRQSAPESWPVLREQRVQIGLYTLQAGLMKPYSILATTYRGETTQVSDAIGLDCPQIVYPNVGDWGYVKVNLDDVSKENMQNHINHVESSLLRLMLWQSSWDSVRDAKLSLYEYLDLVLHNISAEKRINVLELLRNHNSAAFEYLGRMLPQQKASQYREKIESLALQLLQTAEAGSDTQKDWFRHFIQVAHTEKGLAYLQTLLSSAKPVLSGLDVNQDRRWEMVIKLNQFAYGDYEALLTSEAQRDTSERAKKSQFTAQAARPQAEVKREVIDKFIANDAQTKLDWLRAAGHHLFPPSQADLHRQFSQTIVDGIERVNSRDSAHFISAYTRLLPTLCSAQSNQLLQGVLEGRDDFDPMMLKRLKIALQEDQRCVKIAARSH